MQVHEVQFAVPQTLPENEIMKTKRRDLICYVLASFTPLVMSSVATAQSPPHSPTLHFSADYFTNTLSLPGGTSLAGINWLDNVSNATATPFGNDMTIETNVANGHPVVREATASDGVLGNNQWWVSDVEMIDKAPNLLSGTNDYTIMAVVRSFDPPPVGSNVGIAAVWGPGNNNNQYYLSAEPDPPVSSGGYQRTFQQRDPPPPCCPSTFTKLTNFGLTSADITADFNFYGWVKSGGAAGILNNHTNGVTSATTGGVYESDLGPHDQGGFGRRLNFHQSGNFFAGDVAEIIFYDKALDSTQLDDLDTYLNSKYVDPPPTENADFDNNMLVNGNDHLIFQRGFGTDAGNGNVAPQSEGNANGDQFINGADQVIWGNQYGGPPPISAVTSVPEPTSLSLALLACWALLGRDLRLKFKL